MLVYWRFTKHEVNSSQWWTTAAKALTLLFYLATRIKSIHHPFTGLSSSRIAVDLSNNIPLSLSPSRSGCFPVSASSRSSHTPPTWGSCSSERRTATHSLCPNWRRCVFPDEVGTSWLLNKILSIRAWQRQLSDEGVYWRETFLAVLFKMFTLLITVIYQQNYHWLFLICNFIQESFNKEHVQ